MKTAKRVKKDLEKVIAKYKLQDKLSADEVIEWVANEDEEDVMQANRDYQQMWMKYFSMIEDIDELNDILMIFTDVWNCFPHKSLNSKSPMDMYH